MTFKILITILLLGLYQAPVLAQGHIEVIKNQEYLKNTRGIDCNGEIDNQLSARVCANLKFQKSDSLLTIIYKKLLKEAEANKNTAQYKNIVQLQNSWRKLRDQHCTIVYDLYNGGSGNFQAISYLGCLTDMTNSRTKELKDLYKQLHEH